MDNNTIIITKIFWKRTYLFIEYKSTELEELYLYRHTDKKTYRIDLESKKLEEKENTYRAKLNITIADEANMLPAGNWSIKCKSVKELIYNNAIMLNIEDISRVFRYSGENYSYIATFHMKKKAKDETEPYLGKKRANIAEKENLLSLGLIDEDGNIVVSYKKYNKEYLIKNIKKEVLIELGLIDENDNILYKYKKYNKILLKYDSENNINNELVKESICNEDFIEINTENNTLSETETIDESVSTFAEDDTTVDEEDSMLSGGDNGSANDLIDEDDIKTTKPFEDKYKVTLKTSFMKKNKHPEKRTFRDLIHESSKLKTFLHKYRIYLLKGFIKYYYAIVSHITPKNGKRILFMSENRLYIMDNLKAINDRMLERNLDKEFKITYSFRNIFDSKKQKHFEWLKVLTKICLQDYIFIDDYAPIFGYIKLNKKNTLVQTWHAGFGFKLVGYGRFGINGSPKPFQACHRAYTYGIIGNENLKEIYSEVWGISKDKLLPTGLPRLEHFLDKNYIKKIRKSFYEKFPIFKGKEIITFAPTYRGSSQFNATYNYELIDFDKLYKYCQDTNSVVLFGKHHFIKRQIPIKEQYKDLIYDFSEYKLNDVFYITDILITDYSSAFYDFLLLQRPVIFFTYDKDLFSATRGVHRPIENVAPGKVCITFKEVLKVLKERSFDTKVTKNFLIDRCLTNKMLASDKIINYVVLHQEVDFDD